MRFLFAVGKRLPQDHGVSLVNKNVAQVTLLCSKLLWYRKGYFLKISYTIAGKADSRCLKINGKDWETATKSPKTNTKSPSKIPTQPKTCQQILKQWMWKLTLLVFFLAQKLIFKVLVYTFILSNCMNNILNSL